MVRLKRRLPRSPLRWLRPLWRPLGWLAALFYDYRSDPFIWLVPVVVLEILAIALFFYLLQGLR